MDFDDDDAPDCSELLDEFIELASQIADGDELVLRLTNTSASIEMIIDGYSVFKQEKRVNEYVTPPKGESN